MKRTIIVFLLVIATVCALPWTPLWDPILSVGYGLLCPLGVDRWFSANETLVLLNETSSDFSNAANPARQREVERVESLCGAYYVSVDWLLWVDDPGGGPTVRIRAKAWSPDTARGLVSGVVERYNAGEGTPHPPFVTP